MADILEMLARSPYVSGEAMSSVLGMTRAAVWKRIEQLREEGWDIRSAGKKGYRLYSGDRLEPVLWQHALTTRAMGRGEIRFAQAMDSTNDQLRQMAAAGAPHGSLCLCECQTHGKGRLGRTWVSQAGAGLWQSVLLRPNLQPQLTPTITLITAMAMAQALQDCGLEAVRIKWPNDLVAHGRKLCGILCEVTADMDHVDSVICGVGVNVLHSAIPPELTGQATCLEDEQVHVLRREVLVRYLKALEEKLDCLEQKGFDALYAEYCARSCTLGQTVRVQGSTEFTGVAESIDTDGALMVRTPEGELRKVLAGDVSVRGVMGYV